MAEPEKNPIAGEAKNPDMNKTLEAILKRVNSLEEEGKAKDEKIKMLIEVADNARKENYNKKNGKKKITPIVKVSTIEGRVVVAWKTVIDEVFRDDGGVWHEKQVHDYITVDEKGEEKIYTFNLMEVVQKKKIVKIPGEVIERKIVHKDEDTGEEQVNFKLRLEDGREITIDAKFVN